MFFSPDICKNFNHNISPSRYTCEECVEGLNWVQMYMEDPIMIAEFTIYLEQNYCIGDWKPLGGGGELCKLGHYCIDLSNGEGVALRKGYIHHIKNTISRPTANMAQEGSQ